MTAIIKQDRADSFLSQDQEKALEIIDRPVLVIAPPGTGKTEVLTRKYARLVQMFGRDKVIALTFTRKAAAEINARASLLLPGMDDDVQPMIGTFHAIGIQILRRAKDAGVYVGALQIIEDRDQDYVLATALRGYARHESGTAPNAAKLRTDAIKELRREIDRVKNLGLVAVPEGYFDGRTVQPIVMNLPARGSKPHLDMISYQRALLTAGVLDYNDVIINAINVVERYKDLVLPDLRAVLVDEYQDTNAAQERLINLLSKSAHITCVGDDRQSIYGWRGAQIHNILSFTQRYANAVSVELNRNYRSNSSIEKLARRLLETTKAALPLADFLAQTGNVTPPAVTFHTIEASRFNRDANAAAIAAIVARELETNASIRGDDIAILVRANNDATALKDELNARGHNAHILNPNALSSPSLRRMTAWLRILQNPNDLTSIGTICDVNPSERHFTGMLNTAQEMSKSMMHFIVDMHAAGQIAQPVFRKAAETYLAYSNTLQTEGLVALLNAIALNEDASLTYGTDNERQARFWSAFGATMQRAIDSGSLPDVIDHLSDSLVDADALSQLNKGSIEIATIHSMKGRQRRVVFIGPIMDGILPMGFGNRIDPKRMDEERRLFYVALTRASHQVHLVFGNAKNSTFLRDLALTA